MLVTDVGGLSEIVPDGKCGYVVRPEPKYISEAIIDFYDNQRNVQFSQGVKQEKVKFTWDKLTFSILNIYKSA
jgi:glycosyltransferase involved in cell wall biosynthesis